MPIRSEPLQVDLISSSRFIFVAIVSTRSFAKTMFWFSSGSKTVAYSMSGLTAANWFDGNVQGVVVQTNRLVFSWSSSGNST